MNTDEPVVALLSRPVFMDPGLAGSRRRPGMTMEPKLHGHFFASPYG